jgi:hypothetical protein
LKPTFCSVTFVSSICQVYSTKDRVKLYLLCFFWIYNNLYVITSQIYSIRFSNKKVLLNTILANLIQKYLSSTFIIPNFFKFFIQFNTNPMESTMVSKWNVNKKWIYYLAFLWKINPFLNLISFHTTFLYKIPCFHPNLILERH